MKRMIGSLVGEVILSEKRQGGGSDVLSARTMCPSPSVPFGDDTERTGKLPIG